MAKGHGNIAEFRKKDTITILLLGTDDKCKCLVGNKIIQLDHFQPEQTIYQEISLELRDCVVTVINIQKWHSRSLQKIQEHANSSSDNPCMIVFVLQPDNVTWKDLELFTEFQQSFGKKLLGNTIVLLFSDKNKRSAKAGDETGRNLQRIIHQCQRKAFYFNTNMELNDLMNYWKTLPEMQINKNERLHKPTYTNKENSQPGAAAYNNSGHRRERFWTGGLRRAKSSKDRFSSIGAVASPSTSGHRQERSWTDGQDTMTIVLLGQTGSGKSATGNTILRKQHFESYASSLPVTKECKMAEETVCGKKVRVIDTPDFFYEGLRDQNKHIYRCLELSQPGPDAYVLVMELGRFTDGERAIVHNIQGVFGKNTVREIIILFTGKEKLGEKPLSEYIKNTNPHLQQLIESCGSRCLAFNNKDHQDRQIQTLLDMVSEMKRKKGCRPTDICERYPQKELKKKECTVM